MTKAVTVAIPQCPDAAMEMGKTANGDGEGFGCFGLRVIMTVAAILAIAAVALAVCIPAAAHVLS
jgi:hypothetical protein